MNKRELEQRTKQFAISVIRFVGDLPKNKVADVLGYQLLKSGTSVGANYREANRAQSRADFIHKIGIVEKEIAEAQYWLELFAETPFSNAPERDALLNESNELISIFTAIGKSTRRNKNPKSDISNPKSTSDKMGSKSELENPNSPIRRSDELSVKSKIRNPKFEINQ